MNFKIDVTKNEAFKELDRLSDLMPSLIPYTAAKIAETVNYKLAIPGILSGEIKIFGVNTGKTKAKGLKMSFKNRKTGFVVKISTPLFNIFVPGTTRGIAPVPLVSHLKSKIDQLRIVETVTDRIVRDFSLGKIPSLNQRIMFWRFKFYHDLILNDLFSDR